MEDGQEFRSVKTVLSPESVAIVGASERGRWPQDIFNASVQGGYGGDIYLINPRQAEVYGIENTVGEKRLAACEHDIDGPVE